MKSSAPLFAILALSAVSNAQDINAPVAPDTIYVARGGPVPGLSVIDLNGFGASTGDPTYDPSFTVFNEGDTNYPNNPNVKYQGAFLRPPLLPGTTTSNGGSAGVFTLTRDSALQNLLLRAPAVHSISDMMLGHPLDTTYNGGPPPFGCQSGGGNLCALDGKHVVDVAAGGPNTLQPMWTGGVSLNIVTGMGNPISFAPHPNPPPLIDPPICYVPHLRGQEPTSIETIDLAGIANLLAPGDPFGVPGSGIAPSGLLVSEQNTFFAGPSLPQSTIAQCRNYQVRQQIGHWLYIADRVAGEIVVANSNTLRVLRRIAVPDPTELAMGPNLDYLAVTSQATNQMYLVDIQPFSATFHQVVNVTTVGTAPRGIAWDPGNEDILVCNEGSDDVSIVSVGSFQVRKTVNRALHGPFAVAITQRQTAFGYLRNVYLAYILDRAGHVTLFESGPSTVNGWGYDEIIGQAAMTFDYPQAIQPDPLRLTSGVWIAHRGQLDANGHPTGLGGGALTNLVLDYSGPFGPLPLVPVNLPNLRGLSFRVARSIGSDQLSGIPYDIAFDDQRNFGALRNFTSPFSGGAPAPVNGKSQVKAIGSSVVNTNEATYLFAPIRESGLVDVIRLGTGLRIDTNAHQPGVQSIPSPGGYLVMDYFRE